MKRKNRKWEGDEVEKTMEEERSPHAHASVTGINTASVIVSVINKESNESVNAFLRN